LDRFHVLDGGFQVFDYNGMNLIDIDVPSQEMDQTFANYPVLTISSVENLLRKPPLEDQFLKYDWLL
jgi:hypothetical protein